MRRKNARLRAAAVVIIVAIASVAHASFVITQSTATTQPGPLMTPMRIVVSIRNPTSVPQTLSLINRSLMGNLNCPTSVQISAIDIVAIPYPLPANSQIQFLISSTGFDTNDPMPATCLWDVLSADTGLQQFTTVFDIVPTSTVVWDLQPKVSDFGSQSVTAASETQTILINNFLIAASTFTDMVINDPTGSIRFVSDCPGQQSCTGGFSVPGRTAKSVLIACDPINPGIATATFTIYGAAAPLGIAKARTC